MWARRMGDLLTGQLFFFPLLFSLVFVDFCDFRISCSAFSPAGSGEDARPLWAPNRRSSALMLSPSKAVFFQAPAKAGFILSKFLRGLFCMGELFLMELRRQA